MSKLKKEVPPLGLVFLSKKSKIKDLKITVFWLKTYLKEDFSNAVNILPPTRNKALQQEFNNVCKTYRSKKNSETSMLNKAFKYLPGEWNLIVYSGARIKTNIHQRLLNFPKENSDILHPVNHDYTNFIDAPLTWLFVHRSIGKTVGDFDEKLELENSKIAWGSEAITNGCSFKGLLGIDIR